MEFEIISNELIKPSSPTPSHLKTYKLSLFDQFLPPVYTPLILFYPPNNDNISDGNSCSVAFPRLISISETETSGNQSSFLKQSLPETLSQFYPLAGKLKDALSIDCNDEGLHYTNARVMNISLCDYLNQIDLPSMFKLLPKSHSTFQLGESCGSYVCFVQETCFPCGGIAIGLQVLHMAMDGVSMVSFLKAWAAITSKKGPSLSPFVDGSSMFPPSDDFPTSEMMRVLMPLFRRGKFGTRRFVFEASDIERLKAKAKSSSVQNPTRVEVVSSLLMRCIKAARKAKSVAISYPVNIRSRFNPPLPECSMGNFIWFLQTKSDETKLRGLVSELRKAFRGVDMEFVKRIKGCDRDFLKGQVERLKDLGGSDEIEFIACTSWVNFGVYEIDFGWGKPVWVSCVNEATSSGDEILFTSSINLLDAKMEKGIEAYVHSTIQDLSVLEKDEELLSYASLNPSPLK